MRTMIVRSALRTKNLYCPAAVVMIVVFVSTVCLRLIDIASAERTGVRWGCESRRYVSQTDNRIAVLEKK